jgi:hypothetical protein
MSFGMRLAMTQPGVQSERKSSVQLPNFRRFVHSCDERRSNERARFDRDEAWQLTFEEARL